MMRIVCPNCGEEPQKGQRHTCRPAPAPQPLPAELAARRGQSPNGHRDRDVGASACEGVGVQRTRGAAGKATSGVVCASIASLVAKNPALWRSGKALVRCGGEDFVAGLLATAVGLPDWRRDPKRAMVCALVGRLSDEAARALQGFWRERLAARRQAAKRRKPEKGPGGYLRLTLSPTRAGRAQGGEVSSSGGVAAAGGHAQPSQTGRPPDPRHRRTVTPPPAAARSRTAPVSAALGDAIPATRSRTPPIGVGAAALPTGAPPRPPVVPCGLPPSPRQPETPRNKSNPRPNATRGVPTNPIHTLKQRRLVKQQEEEEKLPVPRAPPQAPHEAEAQMSLSVWGPPLLPLAQAPSAHLREEHFFSPPSWPASPCSSGQVPLPATPAFSLAIADAKPSPLPPAQLCEEPVDVAQTSWPAFPQSSWQSPLPATTDFSPSTTAFSPAVTTGADTRPPPLPSSPASDGSRCADAQSLGGGTPLHTEAALTPLERRALRAQAAAEASIQESESRSAPTTLTSWRPQQQDVNSATALRGSHSGDLTPRSAAVGSSPATLLGSATERLRNRLQNRERETSRPRTGNNAGAADDDATPRGSRRSFSPLPAAPGQGGTASWRDRIEARQRETTEAEEFEADERQRVAARSTRRSDAMHRVMERQAQRQDDVASLEA